MNTKRHNVNYMVYKLKETSNVVTAKIARWFGKINFHLESVAFHKSDLVSSARKYLTRFHKRHKRASATYIKRNSTNKNTIRNLD